VHESSEQLGFTCKRKMTVNIGFGSARIDMWNELYVWAD